MSDNFIITKNEIPIITREKGLTNDVSYNIKVVNMMGDIYVHEDLIPELIQELQKIIKENL